jgi:stearoyl-CoA desaturase (delta-9 desaturase)
MHHAYSDGAGDPHSPHVGQSSRWRGFWHAQLWWLIQRVPTYREEAAMYSRFCRDFKHAHPYATSFHQTRRIARFHVLVIIVTYAIGALVESHSAAFLIAGWHGGASCVVWGIGLRSVFALHVTSLVNSATHLWGSRMYETKDHSANNALVALLSLGEGWHNNHHRHAWAANHGFHTPWQVDASFMVVYALGLLGVIWNVKVYDPRTHSRAVLFARTSHAEPSAS